MNISISLTEVLYALGLFAWVIVVVQVISRAVYEAAKKRYGDEYVGIYFARKVIHILAGGLVALLIPVFNLFDDFILPLALAIVLAFLCWWPHRTGKLMYWFQDPSNMYEVDFCLVWGILMALSWLLTGGWWLGVVPILFMALGDGITGIVRNFLFKRRTKHWSGNVAMFAICAPMGYFLGPFNLAGVIAAALASLVEHVEKIGRTYIDDNITVPITAFAVLAAFSLLGIPLTLVA